MVEKNADFLAQVETDDVGKPIFESANIDVASAAAIVHFLWLVKADLREPLIYLGVFVLLMLFRAPALLANLRVRKHGGMRRSSP